VEIAASGQILHDIVEPRGFEPCQRHMRSEFAGIWRQPDALADPLDLALQGIHLRRLRNAGPDRMRFLRAEGTNAFEPELEFRPIDPVEAFYDFIGRAAVDITDKAQGDVVIFHIDPSCSGEATAQQ